jgi:tetratricopeptide (TPR) repeat protein
MLTGVLVTVLVVQSGCSVLMAPPAAPTAGEIPSLQAELERQPGSLAIRMRLAEAYRLTGQAEASLVLLEPVVEQRPEAALALGLAYEALDRFGEARRAYADYVERGRDGSLRVRVRERLAWLERRELEEAVRSALAREGELANRTPTPNTVGVFPLLAVTDDPELKPLGTALAELLTTDLSQTDRLRVLERAQVQALLTELELGESGRVDPATASRGGRLLGAANLVQGRVETRGSDLSVQAVVVNVPGADGARAPLREEDALARIFDLEKRLALALYEQMGIQLTQAERDRVTRRTTSNVQALVAFGYGLEAADAGLDIEAATHFVRALNLDPGFDLARSHWEKADQSIRAAGTSANTLGRLGLAEAGSVSDWRTRFEAVEALMANPAVRDPTAEVLGAEGPGRRGTAEIIIRRPGGN